MEPFMPASDKVKIPKVAKLMWEIEENAIWRFISIWRKATNPP